MVTSYNVISADGYIARKNGDEDFIPDEIWNDFLDLCTEHDVVMMGRKTYEVIQGYDKDLLNPFEKLSAKKVVVSHSPDFQVKAGYIVVASPKDAISPGKNILVTSGPSLNTFMLKEGLLDEVIFNVLPKKIMEGIKPFNLAESFNLGSYDVKKKATGGEIRTYHL